MSSYLTIFEVAYDSGTRMVARWTPPPTGYMKLNVDDSFIESSNRMGSGGPFRDANGYWVSSFSSHDVPREPLLAEPLALKHGLNLAWSLGEKQLICESDSLDAVNALNNQTLTDCHYFAGVVKEVLELLSRNCYVKV